MPRTTPRETDEQRQVRRTRINRWNPKPAGVWDKIRATLSPPPARHARAQIRRAKASTARDDLRRLERARRAVPAVPSDRAIIHATDYQQVDRRIPPRLRSQVSGRGWWRHVAPGGDPSGAPSVARHASRSCGCQRGRPHTCRAARP